MDEGCINASASSLQLNFHTRLGYSYAPFANVSSIPTVHDVGRLANTVPPYIFCKSGGVSYRWYDTGLLLYKAMRKPKSHPASQQDIANIYANGDTWFGDKAVAEDYANSAWGKANGYVVFTFETFRPIRLFRLEVQANWDELGARMAAHEQALLQTKGTIRDQVSNTAARERALAEVDSQTHTAQWSMTALADLTSLLCLDRPAAGGGGTSEGCVGAHGWFEPHAC